MAANQLVATITRETPNPKSYIKINSDSVAEALKALTPVEF